MSIEIEDETPIPPRTDLWSAVVWIVFGAAVAIGAWRMDRLENLHINPYEIPGLVPFILGVTLVVLGLVLALRALRQGAWKNAAPQAAPDPELRRHMAWVFGLMLFYALALVGTGLPFWLATAGFVMVFIAVLDKRRQMELGRGPLQQWLRAGVYGLVWSAVVSLSFEYVFLVRLP
jgi:hypothetical protein